MRFLRNIVLALAFALMLIGNTTALDICFTEGKLSLAGTQSCSSFAVHHTCPCSRADATDCEKKHTREAPHDQITIELDDDIASGKTGTNVPAPTFIFLCAFFETFSEIRPHSSVAEGTPVPPPDPRQILLRPPVATGTRPLLA